MSAPGPGWPGHGGWGPHGPPHPGAPGYGVAPHPGAYPMKDAHPMAFHGHGTHHEFGPAENATIGSTGTWAKALGVIGFVDAGLEVLNLNLVGAGIAFAIALAFWKAGSSLTTVVATQGHDVHHLMQAVQQIGSAFYTRIVVTLLAVGLVAIVAVGLVVVAITIGVNAR